MDAAPPPAPAVLDLPPEFAAALHSPGGLHVRDPRTGARFRLVPSPPATEPEAGESRGTTLREDVEAAVAQMDAGLGMTTDEVRAEMARRHPELRDR